MNSHAAFHVAAHHIANASIGNRSLARTAAQLARTSGTLRSITKRSLGVAEQRDRWARKATDFLLKTLRRATQTRIRSVPDIYAINAALASGADPNAGALRIAAEHGYASVVRRIIQTGGKVDVKDKYGNTPLMYVCQHLDKPLDGHVAIVNMLLFKAKVNINAKNNAGETALMFAVEHGHAGVVQKLIEFGANVNAKTNTGETALTHVAGGEYTRRSPIYTSILQRLLAAGAKTGVTTALIYAAAKGNNPMVRLLLAAGANVNGRENINGPTALIRASKRSSYNRGNAVVETLIKSGGNVNVRDTNGWTALIHAAWNRRVDAVRMLLAAGADVHAKDDTGRTALTMARDNSRQRNYDVIDMIERAMVNRPVTNRGKYLKRKRQ